MSNYATLLLMGTSLAGIFYVARLLQHPHGSKLHHRQVNMMPDDFYKHPVWGEAPEHAYPAPVHQEHPMETAKRHHGSAHNRTVNTRHEERRPESDFVLVDSAENMKFLQKPVGATVVPMSDDYRLGLSGAQLRELHES